MKLKQYVVDAFADRVFTGNPAAVCVTEAELSEAAMLAVAGLPPEARSTCAATPPWPPPL